MISDINEGEKVGRFTDGLKYNVKIEVLRGRCDTLEESVRIALTIDSESWRVYSGRRIELRPTSQYNDTTPMEIGNVKAEAPGHLAERKRKETVEGVRY